MQDHPRFYHLIRTTDSGRRIKVGEASSEASARDALLAMPAHVRDDIGVYHTITGRCVLDGLSLGQRNEPVHVHP